MSFFGRKRNITESFLDDVDKANDEFDKKNAGVFDEVMSPDDNGRLKDVLETLGIPASFELEPYILFPEDLEEVNFSIQSPQGYEMTEVRTLIDQVKASLKHYVHLLNERNSHITKLAQTVDVLQVEISRLMMNTLSENDLEQMKAEIEGLQVANTHLTVENSKLKRNIEELYSTREEQREEALRHSQKIISENNVMPEIPLFEPSEELPDFTLDDNNDAGDVKSLIM